MKASSRSDALLAAVLLGIATPFLLKLFLGADSALYTDVLTEEVLRWIAAVPKLLAFATGAVFGYGCATRFADGTPLRRSWLAIAGWQGTWFVAQTVLAGYQLVQQVDAPYPSLADIFFVLGYPLLIVALVTLVRCYVATGMVGEAREHRRTAVVAAVPTFLAGAIIIAPMLSEGGAPLHLALNVAYPGFDLLALVPTLVLLRLTLRHMGGALFWVWALVGAGTLFMFAGDLLFGYFDTWGLGFLEPLLDLCYIAGYGLVARGIYQQYRISR